MPALLKDSSELQDLIANNWTTFIRHKDRLQLVRENKSKVAVDSFDDSFAHKDSDLYSDAGSTVASSASRSSRCVTSSSRFENLKRPMPRSGINR